MSDVAPCAMDEGRPSTYSDTIRYDTNISPINYVGLELWFNASMYQQI